MCLWSVSLSRRLYSVLVGSWTRWTSDGTGYLLLCCQLCLPLYLSSWTNRSLLWLSTARKTNSLLVTQLMTCCNFITALHVMQTRYCDENSVCLSVCQTRALWQNCRKIGPDLYTIWKNIYPSFLRRRMVGGGRPILPEILRQPAPVGTKSPIFNQ